MDKHRKQRPDNVQPLAYSIQNLARAADVSRGTIYHEINAGRLETKKIGRRRIVTTDAARRWLDGLKS